MDAKGFELLMSAKILGTGGGGMSMDAKGFERLMAAKILGKGGGGKIKELEGVPPLTFTANGQPLLDYRIYGNTVQTGTPTPDNPIIPSGCGERTENLWDGTRQVLSKYLDTSGDEISNSSWDITDYIAITNGDYTMSDILGGLPSACFYDADKSFISAVRYSATTLRNVLLTAPTNAAFVRLSVPKTIAYEQAKYVMLVKGSTAPESYTPYGYKLPISSAGQNVDIYLGEVQTTRRIKKLVLTGEENWYFEAHVPNRTVCQMLVNANTNVIGFCSHIMWKSNYSATDYNRIIISAYGSGIAMYVSIADIYLAEQTLSGFKSYLAAQYANGTPVAVWYVLAEPETGIVNEPLMKIGDYTDTVSMEQAGVSIPTNKGSTTLDVDTTIKPSNVYIKYRS